tara:strand:- start:1832 stop:2074 length:243 start_codon:yes stop_codon:yes gene_type:complete
MLFFIALAMKGLKKSQQYPAEISECPDYWVKNEDNACVPVGNHNKGNNAANCGSYIGTEEKKQFASECGIEWDGVNNITE